MKYSEYLSIIDQKAGEITAVSDAIWDYAEVSYTEHKSSQCLSGALEKNGFAVTRGIAGIPTAFRASYGSGRPFIAIQAEFDALAGLSQEAGIAEKKPIPGKENGHGCGHNLFAGGSFATALAVQAYIKKTGKGTVVFFGCPAEEGGAGKVFMVREGAYRDIDAVVSWHPEKMYMVRTRPSLANVTVDYIFDGIASHAGGSPEKGRSALDAAELMNTGVQYLREHMDTGSRIHYAFLDSGGTAPNVVQAHAVVRYLIRAKNSEAVRQLKARVDKIAEGAAMMTETRVRSAIHSAYSELITIPALQKTADEALHDIPVPVPTKEDIEFAYALRATMQLTEEEKNSPQYALAVLPPAPPAAHGGSTDTADVSWVCPTVQLHIGTLCNGTPGHSWQTVAQGKSNYAKNAMLYAGKAVAGTIIRLFEKPERLAQATAEHKERTARGYICPLPPDLKPPIPE